MLQYGYFMHCMSGWRALVCVLDNLTPHTKIYSDPDDPDFFHTDPVFGFGWVCRLHNWVGEVGKYREGEG